MHPLFFEVFENLPRQGPGSAACTRRAFELCRDLPPSPRIVDLGCGAGAQTLVLAGLTEGEIVAVDNHPPIIDRLRADVAARDLTGRVTPLVADMERLPLEPHGFDLIWSEGALYNLGIEKALEICRGLLRPGGYVAFTDAVWRMDIRPAEVEALFAEYPTMGTAPEVQARIERGGFTASGDFPLPDEAWWDDFYTPMERRIEALRRQHATDPEALAVLDELASEPEMHRRHAASYGYHFFIAQRRP